LSLEELTSTALTQLFLSPLLFVLSFFVGAFFCKSLRVPFFIFGSGLYLFSNLYISNLLLSSLESPFRTQKEIEFKPDFSVCLLEIGENGELLNGSYEAFVGAVAVSKSMNIASIVSIPSGMTVLEKERLLSRGVSFLSQHFGFAKPFTATLHGGFGVLPELASVTLLESSRKIKEIAAKNRVETPKVLLFAKALRLKRATQIYKDRGFRSVYFATGFLSAEKEFERADLLCSYKALSNSFEAIFEYIALIKFFLFEKGLKS